MRPIWSEVMDPPMQDREFLASLCQDREAKASACYGVMLRAKYRPGRGRRLVVLFHPAMPAHSPNRPYFLPFLPVDAPQLSISDPTLEGKPELSAGWYLGDETGDARAAITAFVRSFSDYVGCHERVYVGGSSGGFAALLYSSEDPASIAVAACPQTDLDVYKNSGVEAWRTACYPSFGAVRSIKQLTGVDLIARYSGDFNNAAIIMVSPGDFNHLFTQLAPLLVAIRPQQWNKILVDVRYHGIPKHGGSIPPSSYIPWVRAVLAARNFLADEIMEIHRTITAIKGDERPLHREGGKADARKVPEADLRLAELLRDYHLRDGGALEDRLL